jgi:hypothetical protein
MDRRIRRVVGEEKLEVKEGVGMEKIWMRRSDVVIGDWRRGSLKVMVTSELSISYLSEVIKD